MKTAQEILEEVYLADVDPLKFIRTMNVNVKMITKAMELYADQFKVLESLSYQKCPKCDGQGIVSKPPHLAGDINEWSSVDPVHQCNLCNGNMVIPIEAKISVHISGEVESESVIKLQDEYIELLSDELAEVSTLAYIHGWRSKRHEAGIDIRKRIEQAKTKSKIA